MVRTPPFQGENPGSNPSGAAKIKRPPFGGRFILLQPPGLNRDAPERSAWRIRRRTINNHSKTDIFNRVFDYGWFIVCQGCL